MLLAEMVLGDVWPVVGSEGADLAPAVSEEPALGLGCWLGVVFQRVWGIVGVEGEPGCGAARVDTGVWCSRSVLLGVGEHIDQGVVALGGRADGFGVVAVGEDLAGAIPMPIETSGHAALDSVHGSREGLLVVGFAEEVDVIALDRELDDAEAFSLDFAGQVVEEECNGLGVAKRGEAHSDAAGDVQDTLLREGLSGPMTDAISTSLPDTTGPFSGTAMSNGKTELQLPYLLQPAHGFLLSDLSTT